MANNDEHGGPEVEADYANPNRPGLAAAGPPPILDVNALAAALQANESIKKEQLSIGKVLGKGRFGLVSEAIWARNQVKYKFAAKELHNMPANDEVRALDLRRQLHTEYSAMKKVSGNANIIRAVAMILDGNVLDGFAMELVSGKDLLSILRSGSVGDKDKAKFSLGIASGAKYMHNLGIAHRDLAARNIMIEIIGGAYGNAKIGDFGHARDVGRLPGNTYNAQVFSRFAFAWAAIEAFNLTWTLKSDVWSCAVVLWEIYRNGATPWVEDYFPGEAVTYDGVLEKLAKGYRLKITPRIPTVIATLMHRSWMVDPQSRPSMADVYQILKEYYKSLFLPGESLDVSVSYDEEFGDDAMGIGVQADMDDDA